MPPVLVPPVAPTLTVPPFAFLPPLPPVPPVPLPAVPPFEITRGADANLQKIIPGAGDVMAFQHVR